jgi:hypothetical protein
MNPSVREQIRARSFTEGQNLSLKKLIQFKRMRLAEEYEINNLIG